MSYCDLELNGGPSVLTVSRAGQPSAFLILDCLRECNKRSPLFAIPLRYLVDKALWLGWTVRGRTFGEEGVDSCLMAILPGCSASLYSQPRAAENQHGALCCMELDEFECRTNQFHCQPRAEGEHMPQSVYLLTVCILLIILMRLYFTY